MVRNFSDAVSGEIQDEDVIQVPRNPALVRGRRYRGGDAVSHQVRHRHRQEVQH